VIGKAPREITLKNEALMDNPHLREGAEDPDYLPRKKVEKKEYKYLDKLPSWNLYSKVDHEAERMREEDEKKRIKLLTEIDDDEPDRLGIDPYLGKRVHCWVMIKKGKRDVKKNMFIESSTGRIWELDAKNYPYSRIDQLFNNQNFWINLFPERDIKDLPFDKMNSASTVDWEYVMLDTVIFDMEVNPDDNYDLGSLANASNIPVNDGSAAGNTTII
jgi:hypothetical protein